MSKSFGDVYNALRILRNLVKENHIQSIRIEDYIIVVDNGISMGGDSIFEYETILEATKGLAAESIE